MQSFLKFASLWSSGAQVNEKKQISDRKMNWQTGQKQYGDINYYRSILYIYSTVAWLNCSTLYLANTFQNIIIMLWQLCQGRFSQHVHMKSFIKIIEYFTFYNNISIGLSDCRIVQIKSIKWYFISVNQTLIH